MLLYTLLRLRLGCRGFKGSQFTRRVLKVQSRQLDLIFGFLLTVPNILTAFGFTRDALREECSEDKRSQAMMKAAMGIMFIVSVSGSYLFVLALVSCNKTCQTRRKLRKEPPELSSDENDDIEFIEAIIANRAAEDRRRNEQDELLR